MLSLGINDSLSLRCEMSLASGAKPLYFISLPVAIASPSSVIVSLAMVEHAAACMPADRVENRNLPAHGCWCRGEAGVLPAE